MIKQILLKVRDKFLKVKVYIGRSNSYVVLLNSGMILFLFLSRLKEMKIINLDLSNSFIATVIITFIVLIIFGWLEVEKFSAFKREATVHFDNTPPFVEMKSKVDYLYNKSREKENEN